MIDELVLCQKDQPKIYHAIHQIAQSGVIVITFPWQSWFEVFKEMPATELTKANCYLRHSCSKLLLIDVIFI